MTNMQSDTGYRIQSMDGCKIIWGPIPLSDFSGLAGMVGKKAVMDSGFANLIGATLVMGLPEDIAQLKLRNWEISDQRKCDAFDASRLDLPLGVIQWLEVGERGSSSNAMCKVIFGLPESAGISHPLDPSDFRRCVLFMEKTGGRIGLHKMSDVSPEWAALVARWSEIEAASVADAKNLMDEVLSGLSVTK